MWLHLFIFFLLFLYFFLNLFYIYRSIIFFILFRAFRLPEDINLVRASDTPLTSDRLEGMYARRLYVHRTRFISLHMILSPNCFNLPPPFFFSLLYSTQLHPTLLFHLSPPFFFLHSLSSTSLPSSPPLPPPFFLLFSHSLLSLFWLLSLFHLFSPPLPAPLLLLLFILMIMLFPVPTHHTTLCCLILIYSTRLNSSLFYSTLLYSTYFNFPVQRLFYFILIYSTVISSTFILLFLHLKLYNGIEPMDAAASLCSSGRIYDISSRSSRSHEMSRRSSTGSKFLQWTFFSLLECRTFFQLI